MLDVLPNVDHFDLEVNKPNGSISCSNCLLTGNNDNEQFARTVQPW